MSTTFIHGIENLPDFDPSSTVVTVGTFDGIHKGHQAIFSRVKEVAKQTDLRPVLVTFHPHPRIVVTPDDPPMLLTTVEEKKKFIPHFFDGIVLIVDFNTDIRDQSAEEFVKKLLVDKLGVKQLIVGYDHALGHDRAGDIDQLKSFGDRFGFGLEVIEPVIVGDKPISSSRIRQAVKSGNYLEALDLLGHEYAIYGTVEHGISLGKKLGYPTANVKYNRRKLLPPDGVYACWVQLDGKDYDGMMFIGQNHFNPQADISVEAHLFDFDKEIYDRDIVVYATTYIRSNIIYKETGELVKQLKKDKINVLEILRKGERTCL